MDVKTAAINTPNVAKVKPASPQEHVAALDFAAGLEDIFAADVIEQNAVKADADLTHASLRVAKVTTRERLAQLPQSATVREAMPSQGLQRVWCVFLVPVNALQVMGKRVAHSISLAAVKRVLGQLTRAAVKHGTTAVRGVKVVASVARSLGRAIINGVQRLWRWATGGK